jgi:hypothetical protein
MNFYFAYVSTLHEHHGFQSASVESVVREHEVMKGIARKIALLTLVGSIAPVIAGEEAAVVRNCTWCHGTGVQGYMVAPRLAGQRLSICSTKSGIFTSTRDNPFSKRVYVGCGGDTRTAGRARSRRLFCDDPAQAGQ